MRGFIEHKELILKACLRIETKALSALDDAPQDAPGTNSLRVIGKLTEHKDHVVFQRQFACRLRQQPYSCVGIPRVPARQFHARVLIELVI